MRSLWLACAGVLLCMCPTASAVEVKLLGRTDDKPFSGPGCEAESQKKIFLPSDATHVRPAEDLGSGIGAPIGGPFGFESHADSEFASVGSFLVEEPEEEGGVQTALFTVVPSVRWCSGYTGDPAKDGKPVPASEQDSPETDPTFHQGWETYGTSLVIRYRLERDQIYTVDPAGKTRSHEPARLTLPNDLAVKKLDWRGWGNQVAKATGVIRWEGKTYPARVRALSPDLGSNLEGCGSDRVYYPTLAVDVPALKKSTTYSITDLCRISRSERNSK